MCEGEPLVVLSQYSACLGWCTCMFRLTRYKSTNLVIPDFCSSKEAILQSNGGNAASCELLHVSLIVLTAISWSRRSN